MTAKTSYLINLISDHPRRYRVIEGTLKGRQTVATLFWAQQYQIQGWFGYQRQLSRQSFEQLLHQWAQEGIVSIDERAQTVQLTSRGQDLKAQYRRDHYLPKCGHLSWLANTKVLQNRFLLGIQTVSELAYDNWRYVPIEVASSDMRTVKRWFYRYRPALLKKVSLECQQIAERLEQVDPRWSVVFAYSLVGFGTSGLINQRFEQILKVDANSLALMKQDVWLSVAEQLNCHSHWLLSKLTADLLNRTPLNHSVEQTLRLYHQGMQPGEISRTRGLRITTIREHLLACAILIPGSVDAQGLIGSQRWQDFSEQYQGPVENWQWQPAWGADRAESFFAFRLYQIVRSQDHE